MSEGVQQWQIGQFASVVTEPGESNAWRLTNEGGWTNEAISLPHGLRVRIVGIQIGQYLDVEAVSYGELRGRRFRIAENRYLVP